MFTLTCRTGRVVSVYMDVFKLPEGSSDGFPDGYRFSWIACDSENDSARILFDCHPPKGPHIHVDGDPDGEPFIWESLEVSYELFFERVRSRFGEFEIAEVK